MFRSLMSLKLYDMMHRSLKDTLDMTNDVPFFKTSINDASFSIMLLYASFFNNTLGLQSLKIPITNDDMFLLKHPKLNDAQN